jgi:hypothetical protein
MGEDLRDWGTEAAGITRSRSIKIGANVTRKADAAAILA